MCCPSFCSELKSTEHAQFLSPFLPHYLRSLSEMAGEFSDDVVSLAVDSLQLVAQVHCGLCGYEYCHHLTSCFNHIAQIDPAVTAQCADQLVPIATSLFLKFAHGRSQVLIPLPHTHTHTHTPHTHTHTHIHSQIPVLVCQLKSYFRVWPIIPVATVIFILDFFQLLLKFYSQVETNFPWGWCR